MIKRLNQRGAVSLISVVIFIIIISIVILAYLASALSQQRSAVNFDMSTRAYYSAESGIQDAVRALQDDPSLANKENCKPLKGGEASGKLGNKLATLDYGLYYTCQIIDPQPDAIRGDAGSNGTADSFRTAMFRLSPATQSSKYSLVIRWSPAKLGEAQTPSTLVPRTDNAQSLPQLDQWQNNANQSYNALLRVGIISHPSTATISRGDITQRVAFLNPAASAQTLSFDKSSSSKQADLVSNAACTTAATTAEFMCEKRINLTNYNFATDTVYLRVGALYRATQFSVQLVGEDNTPLPLANAQATVDVTGRAKNVYRRVRQAMPLDGGYFTDTEPDAALISGEGICKLFSVTADANQFNSTCNPLQ